MLVFSVVIISGLDSQSKFQMFTLFSVRHIGVPTWRFHPGRGGGGGGGDSHMKQMGMLFVSPRGVNFGFRSRLGCSG